MKKLLLIFCFIIIYGVIYSQENKEISHNIKESWFNNTGMFSRYHENKWKENGLYYGFQQKDEILSLRTQHSKTFEDVDGARTFMLIGDLHYQDENQVWQDILVDLTSTSNGFKNLTNKFKTYYSNNSADGIFVKYNKTEFVLAKNTEIYFVNNNDEQLISQNINAEQSDFRSLNFTNIVQNIDYQQIQLGNGVETCFWLKNKTDFTNTNSQYLRIKQEFSLPENCYVLVDKEKKLSNFSANSFEIMFANGDRAVKFNPIVLYDAAFNFDEIMKSIEIKEVEVSEEEKNDMKPLPENLLDAHKLQLTYNVRFENGKIVYYFDIPTSWLTDENHIFPIFVDPDFTIGYPGSAVTGTGTTGQWAFYNTFYWNQRWDYRLTNAELTAGGFGTGCTISAIGLLCNQTPGQTINSPHIRLNNITWNSSSWITTGWSDCWTASTLPTPTVSTTTWNNYTFSSSFSFNPANGGLVINLSRNNSSYTSNGGNYVITTTITTEARRGYQDSGTSWPHDGMTGGIATSTVRPATKLVYACDPPCDPVNLNATVSAPVGYGNSITISSSIYCSDYSVINNCVAGTNYTIACSSPSITMIVRQGSSTGTTIMQGFSPLTFTPPTTGTYYIVWCCPPGGGGTGTPASGTITSPPYICTYSVCLHDTWGDGWNGGQLNVVVQGTTALSGATVATGYGPSCYNFSVSPGQSIVVNYTAGSYSAENYYRVYNGPNGTGTQIYGSSQGSTPPATQNITNTCVMPCHTVDITSTVTEITCTNMQATLTANVTNAQGTPTYLWSNGATTSSITVTDGSSYFVTVTTGQCSMDDNFNLIQNNTPPIITFSSPTTELTCDVQNIEITSAGGSSYIWSTGETTALIYVTSPDDYYVTATGANGCTSSNFYPISQDISTPDILITKPSSVISCYNPAIPLTASGGVSYEWSSGGDFANPQSTSITVSEPNTYTVSVTGTNGCTAQQSVPITIDTITPQITLNYNPSELTCIVNNITITASGADAYQWDSGETTAVINVTSPGTYSLTVTNSANGCTANIAVPITINIIPPTVGITCPTTILNCFDLEIPITATGGGTYLWNTGATTSSITVSTPNLYMVTVTDGYNGCTKNGYVVINQNVTLPTPVITSKDTILTCLCPSIELTAGGGNAYLWSTGDITKILDVTEENLYTVTVIDSITGCTATTSLNIVADNLPPITKIICTDTIFSCKTNSITLSVNTAGKYNWSNGIKTREINITRPNSYTITVTNPSNGCTASDHITINKIDDIEAVFYFVSPTCVFANNGGFNIAVSGGILPYSVHINNADYGNNDSIRGLFEGIYNIEIFDSLGCRAEYKQMKLTANDFDCLLIPNAITPNGDDINDTWILDGIENFPEAKIMIFNRWGQNIYNSSGQYVPWDGKYKNKLVPAGTYLYIIQIVEKKKYSGSVTVIY